MTTIELLESQLATLHSRANGLLKLYHGSHDQKKHGKRGAGTGRRDIAVNPGGKIVRVGKKSTVTARIKSTGQRIKVAGPLFNKPEFKGSKIGISSELRIRKSMGAILHRNPKKFKSLMKKHAKGNSVTSRHLKAMAKVVASDLAAFKKAGVDPFAKAPRKKFLGVFSEQTLYNQE